jgi:hypothetical protein
MKIKKHFLPVLVCCFILFAFTGKVYAQDSVNIEVESTQATVDNEVSVTLSLSGNSGNIEMVDLWIEYDASILTPVSGFDQGGGGKIRILSTSGAATYTVKFNAVAAGESTVAVLASQSIVSTPDSEQNRAQITASEGKVTVKGTVKQSAVNTLSSLSVSPGTLEPAFSKDTTTYNITLTESCTKLTVSAVPEDSKAKVSVTGASMDPGNNVTKVTVTAENGDTKVYTIYTKVPETATTKADENTEVIIEVNGTKYKVLNKFDETLLPEGYEQNDYLYQKNTISIGRGLSNGQIIFCVTDASAEASEPFFVLYNEQNGSFSTLNLITSKSATYTVIDVISVDGVDIPDGYVESVYKINNVDYRVFVEEGVENPESFLIYCANLSGNQDWYRYDTAEGTMQRAFLVTDEAVQETTADTDASQAEQASVDSELAAENEKLQNQYDDYVKKSKLALTLMAVLLAAIVLVVAVFIVKSFADSHDELEEYEEPEEYEDEEDDDDDENEDDDDEDDDDEDDDDDDN